MALRDLLRWPGFSALTPKPRSLALAEDDDYDPIAEAERRLGGGDSYDPIAEAERMLGQYKPPPPPPPKPPPQPLVQSPPFAPPPPPAPPPFDLGVGPASTLAKLGYQPKIAEPTPPQRYWERIDPRTGRLIRVPMESAESDVFGVMAGAREFAHGATSAATAPTVPVMVVNPKTGQRYQSSIKAPGTMATPVSEMMEGIGKMSTPLLIAGGLAAPLRTALTVGAGMLAGEVTKRGLTEAGADPEDIRLASNAAQFITTIGVGSEQVQRYTNASEAGAGAFTRAFKEYLGRKGVAEAAAKAKAEPLSAAHVEFVEGVYRNLTDVELQRFTNEKITQAVMDPSVPNKQTANLLKAEQARRVQARQDKAAREQQIKADIEAGVHPSLIGGRGRGAGPSEPPLGVEPPAGVPGAPPSAPPRGAVTQPAAEALPSRPRPPVTVAEPPSPLAVDVSPLAPPAPPQGLPPVAMAAAAPHLNAPPPSAPARAEPPAPRMAPGVTVRTPTGDIATVTKVQPPTRGGDARVVVQLADGTARGYRPDVLTTTAEEAQLVELNRPPSEADAAFPPVRAGETVMDYQRRTGTLHGVAKARVDAATTWRAAAARLPFKEPEAAPPILDASGRVVVAQPQPEATPRPSGPWDNNYNEAGPNARTEARTTADLGQAERLPGTAAPDVYAPAGEDRPAAEGPDDVAAARSVFIETVANQVNADPELADRGWAARPTPEGHVELRHPEGGHLVAELRPANAMPFTGSDNQLASLHAEMEGAGRPATYRVGETEHPAPRTAQDLAALPQPHQDAFRSEYQIAGLYNPSTGRIHINEDFAFRGPVWREELFHAGSALLTPEERDARGIGRTKAEEEAAHRRGVQIEPAIYARQRGNLSSEGQPHGQEETYAVARPGDRSQPDRPVEEVHGARPDARGTGAGPSAPEVIRREGSSPSGSRERPSLEADIDRLIAAVAKPDGGFTYHPTRGSPATGFAVSVRKDAEAVFAPADVTFEVLSAFADKHADVLYQDGVQNHIGAWHNPDDGKVYLDISRVVKTAAEADRLGTENEQHAYADLSKGKSTLTQWGEARKHERLRDRDAPTVLRGGRLSAPTLVHKPEPSYAVVKKPRDRGGLDLPRLVRAPQQQVPGTSHFVVSSRVPEGVEARAQPPGQALETRLVVLTDKAMPPDQFDVFHRHAIALPVLTDRDLLETANNPKKLFNRLVDREMENLQFLWDEAGRRFGDDVRQRMGQWYPGANWHARQEYDRFDGRFSMNQIGGVLGTLSPQKDWYMNVALQERITDAFVKAEDHKNLVFTKTLFDHLRDATLEPLFKRKAKPDEVRETEEKLATLRGKLQGLRWKTMKDPERAYVVRAMEWRDNPRTFHIILPEGDKGALKTNKDGKTPSQIIPQSYPNITKALSILRDGTPENIDTQLGPEHKVRSFHNNIIDPWDSRFATMDTHAVGANLLLPVGSDNLFVNAGMNGPSAGAVGLSGTSVLFAEPYFRLAARLSKPGKPVLPRMVQSVTWETIRGMYRPEQKRQTKAVGAGRTEAAAEAAVKLTPKQKAAASLQVHRDYLAGKIDRDAYIGGLIQYAKSPTLAETYRIQREWTSGKIDRDEYLRQLLVASRDIEPPDWVDTPSRLAAHEGPVPLADVSRVSRVSAGPRAGEVDPGGPSRGAAVRPGGDVSDARQRARPEDDTAPSYSVKRKEPDARAGSGRGVAVSSSAPGRPAHNADAQDVAHSYNAARGLPPVKHDYATVDEPRARAIADAYDALPEYDRHPEVAHAYSALRREIRAQWDHITKTGVVFEPWTKDGQPYQNSTEMADDVRQNKHLYFFTGGEPHPLLDERDPKTGLTDNEKLRAVHDYFGHAAGGFGFGARGEESAWIAHSQMFSPAARRAMTTETRGQNSWVNFGRHNYNDDGSYKHVPPADRPYAQQKVALLPAQYVSLPAENEPSYSVHRKDRDDDSGPLTIAKLQRKATADGVSLADAVAQARADGRDIDVSDYFNLGRVDVPPAERKALNDQIVDTVVETGRVPMEHESWDTIREEAKQLGGVDLQKELEPFMLQQPHFRAVRDAARHRINELSREIADQRVAMEGMPTELAMEEERAINEKDKTIHKLLDTVMRIGSEDGRTLAMHRMMADSMGWDWTNNTYWLSKAKRELGLPPGVEIPPDIYARLQEILKRGKQARDEAKKEAGETEGETEATEPRGRMTSRPPVEGPVLPPKEPSRGRMTSEPPVEGPVLPPVEPREGSMTSRPRVEGPVLPPEPSRGEMTRGPAVEGPVLPPREPSRGDMTRGPEVEGPVLPPREDSRGRMTSRPQVEGPVLPPEKSRGRMTTSDRPRVEGPVLPPEKSRGRMTRRTPSDKEKAVQIELVKLFKELKQTDWWTALALLRKANLLTGVKTHLRNVTGNTTFQIMEELSRVPASMVDAVISLRTGVRTVQGASVRAMFHAGQEGATRGIREAKDVLKHGTHTPTELRTLGASREMNTGYKALDAYTNFVMRSLSAEDRVFRAYAYRRSLEAQAALMAKNSKGAQTAQDILAEPTEAMKTRAEVDAEFATFNNKNILASAWNTGHGALRRGGPVGKGAALVADVVVPFTNTPSNILARLLDYTPIFAAPRMLAAAVQGARGGGGGKPPTTPPKGQAAAEPSDDAKKAASALVKKGLTQSQQELFSMAAGRLGVGMAVMMLGYWLAEKALATGVRDEDEGKRNVKEAAGQTPGSVLVNGNWRRVDSVAPFGQLITLGATLHEQGPTLLNMGKAALKTTSELPMLEGVNQFVQAVNEPGRFLPRFISGQVGSFIPTALSDVASVADKYRRDPRPSETAGDILTHGARERIPVLREGLPVRTNVFGEPLEQRRISAIDPTLPSSDRSSNMLIRELQSHDVGISSTSKVKDLETDDEHRARAIAVGQAIKEKLEALLDSDYYQGLDFDKQTEMLESAIEKGRNTVKRPQKKKPGQQ